MEKGSETLNIEVDAIMVAAGRKPNTGGLNLESIGVVLDRGYVKVNPYLQTSIPHIYAIGDVNGAYPFTHKAGYEGKQVVAAAVLGLKRKVDYSNLPWVTFTDPELFHLGLTEEEARSKHENIKVYKTELDDVDRFVTDHETNGMIKIITDRKGAILGAHAVGSGAGDLMQEVVYARHYGKKIGSLSHVIHPYPVRATAVQRTADLYWREKLSGGLLPGLIKQYIKRFR